ncbi:hypothetical protein RJ641_007908, partial [Dillenia turbinata]
FPFLKAMSPQVITCKAAVCWGAGEPVKVEEIEVDPPKAEEVRLKMLCASLCHSDIICQNGFPFVSDPHLILLSLSLSLK